MSLLIQPLIEEIGRLAEFAATHARRPEFAKAAEELSKAAEQKDSPPRPLLVALVGGSGVGKSELFNALIGQPGASSVSGVERCHTRQPVIACARGMHAALPPDIGKYTPVEWSGSGAVALADTPDVDGGFADNCEHAESLISQADLIVYVTNKHKYKSDKVLEEVKRWARPKRWFFVLNQRDNVNGDITPLLADFHAELGAIGFEADGEFCFATNATRPNDADTPRLRATIFSERSVEAIRLHQEDAVLGRIQAACRQELAQVATGIAERLKAARGGAQQSLVKALEAAIGESRLRERLVPMVRARAWAAVPANIGGMLALPLMLRARTAAFGAAFHGWRLASGGAHLWRIWSFTRALHRAWLGGMELESLLRPVEDAMRGPLSAIEHDVKRKLEDEKLVSPNSPEASPTWAQELAEMAKDASLVTRPFLRVAARVAKTVEQSPVTRALAPLVAAAIEKRAAEIADFKRHRWWLWLLQIPPAAAIAHVLWRVADNWLNNHWLPGEFFLHALTLYLLMLLPGAFLIGWLTASRLRDGSQFDGILEDGVSAFPAIGEARVLDEMDGQMRKFAQAIDDLRERALQLRRSRAADFKAARLGTSALG